MEGVTIDIARRVEELRKQEYSYRKVFDMIREEFPSFKTKDYTGAPDILCREAAMLLQNLRSNPHNED